MPLVMMKGDARARLKPCLRCGYSLRNNIDARNCPECGLAVRITLRGDDSLDWSNPSWLRRTTRATAVILLAHVVFLASLVLVQVNFISMRRTGGFTLFRAAGVLPSIGEALLGVGGLALASFEGRYPDRVSVHRAWLRVAASLLLPMAAWNLLNEFDAVGGASPAWVDFFGLLAAALMIWAYLYELMRRVPSRRCKYLIWCLSMGLLLTPALLPFAGMRSWLPIIMRVDPWSTMSWPWTVTTLIYVPTATALIAACVWQLRAAQREAERNWVTDP